MSEISQFSVLAGWIGILAGIISGAIIGLFFHRSDWMGGYASFRRRLMRLGHISFIGIGILNLFFGFTAASGVASGDAERIAEFGSISFAVALVTMPLVCFLTAWKKPFRHLFFIPVLSATGGVVSAILMLNH